MIFIQEMTQQCLLQAQIQYHLFSVVQVKFCLNLSLLHWFITNLYNNMQILSFLC